MPFTTLISATELQTMLAQSQPLKVFDCTADLSQPAAGPAQFLQGHVPTAIHASLDHDLSAHGTGDAASGGRHPLPSRERFSQWLHSVGLEPGMQVVVYDRNGLNFCVRLWWMLKWAGHDAVAVLDGGLQAWTAAGGALAQGPAAPPRPSRGWALQLPLRQLVGVSEVLEQLPPAESGVTLLDARAPARYRGEVEPLDPVAGHIPGALNRPFGSNLNDDGHFKSPAQLRQEFDALLAGRDPARVVHYCGSGVSALSNLLAMEVAGYTPTRLFAGSWSEWCRDPLRPVERC